MDKAEAKDILNGYRLLLHEESDLRHAFDLAIEALGEPTVSEKESVEGDAETATTTDCISRQQAIDAIEDVDWYHVNPKGELVHGSTSDEESWYRAEDIYKAIESLPSVIPTERTGEWILDDGTPICSACHKEPYCGAKMGGDTE